MIKFEVIKLPYNSNIFKKSKIEFILILINKILVPNIDKLIFNQINK